MKNSTMVKEHKQVQLNTALYIRLSREDGDKTESLSIGNQRLQLMEFLKQNEELSLYDIYIDDGFTGTNFDRPDFQRMIQDIEDKKVQCVVVKDLSRLGRNLIKVSEYINEYFPSKKVRFIAIGDMVDRQYYDINMGEDMIIDMKNLFNAFYPKDIARKVRDAFESKRKDGQFIGAFACYGYKKSEYDHNQLVIDEYAAEIVRRIYNMFIGGLGQNTIAKKLNEEGIPCPSEYKKQCGFKYHNSNKLEGTSYWTYSTIRKILQNEMYIGNMVQNKSFRPVCKKHAISLEKDKWIIVKNTHEPIIDKDTWDTVQNLLERKTRNLSLTQNIHMFAGFIKCGDCERALVKLKRKEGILFRCGSYHRYGNSFCSPHDISESDLEKIILDDLNLIIKSVKDLSQLIESEQKQKKAQYLSSLGDVSKCKEDIERIQRKKEGAYEDYADNLISKNEYLRFKAKCEEQIAHLQSKMDMINQTVDTQTITVNPWIERLLNQEPLEQLDRETIIEMISMIYIYKDNTIKIVYNFSNELETLLQKVSA